jgi:hypothetical protein
MENKLNEFKGYQSLSEEYILLVNKISSYISSEQRRSNTREYYEHFMKNVQSNALICFQLYLEILSKIK